MSPNRVEHYVAIWRACTVSFITGWGMVRTMGRVLEHLELPTWHIPSSEQSIWGRFDNLISERGTGCECPLRHSLAGRGREQSHLLMLHQAKLHWSIPHRNPPLLSACALTGWYMELWVKLISKIDNKLSPKCWIGTFFAVCTVVQKICELGSLCAPTPQPYLSNSLSCLLKSEFSSFQTLWMSKWKTFVDVFRLPRKWGSVSRGFGIPIDQKDTNWTFPDAVHASHWETKNKPPRVRKGCRKVSCGDIWKFKDGNSVVLVKCTPARNRSYKHSHSFAVGNGDSVWMLLWKILSLNASLGQQLKPPKSKGGKTRTCSTSLQVSRNHRTHRPRPPVEISTIWHTDALVPQPCVVQNIMQIRIYQGRGCRVASHLWWQLVLVQAKWFSKVSCPQSKLLRFKFFTKPGQE